MRRLSGPLLLGNLIHFFFCGRRGPHNLILRKSSRSDESNCRKRPLKPRKRKHLGYFRVDAAENEPSKVSRKCGVPSSRWTGHQIFAIRPSKNLFSIAHDECVIQRSFCAIKVPWNPSIFQVLTITQYLLFSDTTDTKARYWLA